MHHRHIPKLEGTGFIHWNHHDQQIEKGPVFDEVRPLYKYFERMLTRYLETSPPRSRLRTVAETELRILDRVRLDDALTSDCNFKPLILEGNLAIVLEVGRGFCHEFVERVCLNC